jgi:transposase
LRCCTGVDKSWDKFCRGIKRSISIDQISNSATRYKNPFSSHMPRTKTPQNSSTYKNRKNMTEDLYKQIVELHNNEGLKGRAIADKLNVGKSTVYRHLASFRKSVPVENMRPYCRPPKITPKQRSALGQLVARQDVPTSKQVTAELSATTGVTVTPRTVRRHLSEMGYKSSVPRTVPLLTSQQKQKRIDWCKEHQGFDWKKVWFSDETYIEVNHTSTPVWHKKGQRPTVAKPKFRVKIMCWGAVSTRFKSKLAIVHGTMTAQRYIETLQGYLLGENSRFIKTRAVFQQDGASCHTAKLSRDFFSSTGIDVLPWPSNSPDLNPIENVWAVLKQNVEKRSVKTKDDLIRVVQEEWDRLSMDFIKKTIDSMENRLSQVIKNKGKKCEY